ncbi:MAG: transposase [Actinobacteria bacterium]|nr:transposase [Actinomycetota bacterium]
MKHKANKNKTETIVAMFEPYRDFAQDIAGVQWNHFFATGRFSKYIDNLHHIPSMLTERQKQTCRDQVVGILESFVSNRANDFKRIVFRSSSPEDVKLQLFYINKRHLWYHYGDIKMPLFLDGERVKGEFVLIGSEVRNLARKIFARVLSRHRRPTYQGINLALDAKVASILPREENKATEFDYWLKISTLDKGHPTYIPLQTNYYFEDVDGELKNFCFVNLKDDGNMDFCLVKDKNRLPYRPMIDELSLDWGLCVMFATEFGDLYGRNFFDQLKRYDEILTELARGRQKRKLNTASKRYKALRGKIRDYIKNEINRVLNRIARQYRPARIVVEKLDFRNQELSKRMNRLLSRCGRSAIEAKLQTLSEDYGIEVEYINPAYTSQECSICGWTEENNRKSRDGFVCRNKNCSTMLHADVNGARVIRSRSSTPLANPYVSREAIFNALRDQFSANVERYPCWPNKTVDRERRNSPAGAGAPRGAAKSKELCGNNVP